MVIWLNDVILSYHKTTSFLSLQCFFFCSSEKCHQVRSHVCKQVYKECKIDVRLAGLSMLQRNIFLHLNYHNPLLKEINNSRSPCSFLHPRLSAASHTVLHLPPLLLAISLMSHTHTRLIWIVFFYFSAIQTHGASLSQTPLINLISGDDLFSRSFRKHMQPFLLGPC